MFFFHLYYSETGLLSFGSAKAIRDYSTALKTNNVDHRTLTSKEINEWYSKQLKVPEEYLGIHVKQAGLIRATRSVATLQVCMTRIMMHFESCKK